MTEDRDEAKLYRMAGWASRQEHLQKSVAAMLARVHNEITKQYGNKAPLPAAKLAVENLIDYAFRQMIVKVEDAPNGKPEPERDEASD